MIVIGNYRGNGGLATLRLSIRVRGEYFGAVGQCAFQAQEKAVFVLDANPPGKGCGIKSLIAGYKGMLDIHALVEADFSTIYEDFDFFAHFRKAIPGFI